MFEMFFVKQNQMHIQLFQGKINISYIYIYINNMIIYRFLEFLSLLVNEPGNSKLTQQFLPTIIELCTTALYPAIREVNLFDFNFSSFFSLCLEFCIRYSRKLL